jgi:hypothetical protein
MPALILLLAAPVLNYVQHKLGRPTICSTCRRFIGPHLMTALVLGIVGWFIPHYTRPFARALAAAADVLDDLHDVSFETEE